MRYRARITEMEEDIKTIMQEEQEERQIRAVENQANKAQRLLENGTSGEKREWFQTHRQRMEEKGKSMSLAIPGERHQQGEIVSLSKRTGSRVTSRKYGDAWRKVKVCSLLCLGKDKDGSSVMP